MTEGYLGYHKVFHRPNLESIAGQIPRLPESTKFCEFLGDKYECCKKKICFDNGYCSVRNFRNKYD